MSESCSAKPSFYSHSATKFSASKPLSSLKRFSSKRSYFSTATVKPSFFSSGLEAFSKHSVYRKNTFRLNEIVDLSQMNSTIDDVEESGLANWDTWLSRHKLQQEDLAKKLNRPPECMVMNTNFHNLPTNQEKQMITLASQIPHPDKHRGDPIFWKPDDTMEHHPKPVGVYQRVQEKYDRSSENYFPKTGIFEYVGVPTEIHRQKGLSDIQCLPTPQVKWDNSLFVKEKKKQLKGDLKIVLEHTPDVSELVVLGRSMNKSEVETCGDSQETVKCIESSLTNDFEPSLKPSFLLSVTVGNKIFDKNSNKWTVTFGNCFTDEIYKESLVIKNLEESSALKYCWNLVLPSWVGNDLPLKHLSNRSKCFYFDKTSASVLPGEKRTLKFYFKSPSAGVYVENWELQICSEPDRWKFVTLELEAVAAERAENRDSIRAIDEYLESCTRYAIARKAVNELIDRGRPETLQELPYDWKFFEEQLFIYNNPNYFYDSSCVSILRSLFEKVSEGPWDLSIENLRELLVKKSPEKSTKTEDLELFSSTIRKLMQQTSPTVLVNEKRKTVYELLCGFVNRMEDEAHSLKVIYNIPIHLKTSNESLLGSKLSLKAPGKTAKLSTRSSNASRKSVRKMSLKSKFVQENMSLISGQLPSIDEDRDEPSLVSDSYCVDENTKQEFLEAFFIKTYHFLGQTIDHISAVIDSFDNYGEKPILRALKK